MTETASGSTGTTQLARTLGLWSIVGLGLGYMTPTVVFDTFGIGEAEMRGWWDAPNGVTVDRPETLVTAYVHPRHGVLLAIGTWHTALAEWTEMTLDVSLLLDRARLGLPAGALVGEDVLSGAAVDLSRPVPLPDVKAGRLLWVRGK